jgi:hypothetical protein
VLAHGLCHLCLQLTHASIVSTVVQQVGGTVVRSLPTDGGSGFVDVPESGPTDPKSPKDIDEELLLAYGGQGSGVTGQ